MQIPKIKQSFTLAEVLITLAVIGVLASMTIPGMINNINNQEYITKWKKSYSELNNVMKIIGDEQTCSGTLHGEFEPIYNCVFDEMEKKLNVAKACNAPVPNECLNITTSDKVKCLRDNGSSASCGLSKTSFNGNIRTIVLTDGTTIMHTRTSGGAIPEVLYIDTNGRSKGPNQFGKDFYRANLNYNFINYGTEANQPSLIPYGYQDRVPRYPLNNQGCSLKVDIGATGHTCAADYLSGDTERSNDLNDYNQCSASETYCEPEGGGYTYNVATNGYCPKPYVCSSVANWPPPD